MIYMEELHGPHDTATASFKIGDVVRLKSGGAGWVIVELFEGINPADCTKHRCAAIIADGQGLQRLPVSCLEHVTVMGAFTAPDQLARH